MPWKEADLIADLQSKYKAVGTPNVLEHSDEKNITWLSVNVFDVAEYKNIPIAHRKNIEYYVFHRGEPNEEAYYKDWEPPKIADSVAKI